MIILTYDVHFVNFLRTLSYKNKFIDISNRRALTMILIFF